MLVLFTLSCTEIAQTNTISRYSTENQMKSIQWQCIFPDVAKNARLIDSKHYMKKLFHGNLMSNAKYDNEIMK